jgi:predicted phage terminase large subunit-like protein
MSVPIILPTVDKDFKLTPLQQLKVIKTIDPSIFTSATPAFHFDLLSFISSNTKYKAAASFRNAGKTTILNKTNILCRVMFGNEPLIILVSSDSKKASLFLENLQLLFIAAEQKGFPVAKGDTWSKEVIDVIIDKGKKDIFGKSLERKTRIVSLSVGQDPKGYIVGSARPTLIVCDDMESSQGQFAVTSASNRIKVKKYFYKDLLPTLDALRGEIIVIGTIEHDDSILNNIIYGKKEKQDILESGENSDFAIHRNEWSIRIYPSIRNGIATWRSRLPLEKIEAERAMYERNGLINEFYQTYMCRAFAPEKQLFKREYFNYFKRLIHKQVIPTITMKDDNLKDIQISCPQPSHIELENGSLVDLSVCDIYSTMDLASYDGADRTAIVTFAHAPDNNIYILDVSCGHWTPYQKAQNATRVQVMFNPTRFGIEKASAQNDFFATIHTTQIETGVRINVCPLSHHSQKKNIRITHIHPYFIVGRIFFNKSQAATMELEGELLSFDPETESKHDDLMDALAYMVEFIGSRDKRLDKAAYDDYDTYMEAEPYF